jgi:hypothetical protein
VGLGHTEDFGKLGLRLPDSLDPSSRATSPSLTSFPTFKIYWMREVLTLSAGEESTGAMKF